MFRLVVFGFVVFNVGFFIGACLVAIGAANKSTVLFKVTRRDGSVQWFTTPEDVQTCLAVDGMCGVERIRVLP